MPWHTCETSEIILCHFREFKLHQAELWQRWSGMTISKQSRTTEVELRNVIKHVLLNRLTWRCWSKTSFKPSDHLIFPWCCGTARPWLLITLTYILFRECAGLSEAIFIEVRKLHSKAAGHWHRVFETAAPSDARNWIFWVFVKKLAQQIQTTPGTCSLSFSKVSQLLSNVNKHVFIRI